MRRNVYPRMHHLSMRWSRWLSAGVLIALFAACTKSFVPDGIGDRCDLPDGGVAPCPDGTYCAWVPLSEGGGRTCRVVCEGYPDGFRCASGEACQISFEPPPAPNPPTCWPGGDRPEGAECRASFSCARGLWCAEDHSGPAEFGARCEPVCNSDADCTRTGERCISNVYCAAPCDPADPSTCPDGAVCRNSYCAWAPRAADCDGDGTPECPLEEICTGLEPFYCFAPVDYVGW